MSTAAQAVKRWEYTDEFDHDHLVMVCWDSKLTADVGAKFVSAEDYTALERRVPTWQPIETAPKDGASVLGWFPIHGGRIYSTQWSEDRYARKPRPLWDVHSWIWGRLELREHQPTHWMPLPAPPDAGGQS